MKPADASQSALAAIRLHLECAQQEAELVEGDDALLEAHDAAVAVSRALASRLFHDTGRCLLIGAYDRLAVERRIYEFRARKARAA